MKHDIRQKQLADLWSALRQPGSGWTSAKLVRRLNRLAIQERTAIPGQVSPKGERRRDGKKTEYRHSSVMDDRICEVAANGVKAFSIGRILSTTAVYTRRPVPR